MRNNIDILGLYRIKSSDKEKLVTAYLDAFSQYPKLMNAFPDASRRIHALEATIRFYTAYDLKFGSGFSLDPGISEAVMLVHSDNMEYSFMRCLRAGCRSAAYRRAVSHMTREEKRLRTELFDELDRLEKTVDVPCPHIYADFLGVRSRYQHQGRGRRLMSRVCRFSDETGLPVMLFTNTPYDVKFYQSLGFRIIGETSSERFGFVNTYMLYT